jgi:hypothetical protein
VSAPAAVWPPTKAVTPAAGGQLRDYLIAQPVDE